ncbi:hypothetical protein DFH08DRAFT_771041 [Mycena albidolilacea]|uniref:N-acetyltransferase domain-containing protein n=1 Tax=Mycena albidolilacea TaxID=1033008 RepID=A0AAD7AG10_9AGAR|nr:hypothetical protein DFH08DRAFT_771041 [Mycena albidolilacea]
MASSKQEFLVREAQEPDVEGMRVALWEAFQHELPRTRPLALEDPAGFAAETTARTLSTIRDAASPFKWFVATPSESGDPNTIAAALLWERVANANAAPFEPATTAPWGGPAQAAAHNAFAVAYRAAVGVRPHFVLQVMATHPAFQGQGAGSALLRHVTAVADAERMLSYVDSSPASLKVYGRFGWVAVGKGRLLGPGPEPTTGEEEPMYATMMLREPVSGASTEAA